MLLVLTSRISLVAAEGDGTKLFASCLAFYDDVPPELAAKHEDLCGAQSLKAICLLSHKPYLTTCEKVSSARQVLAQWSSGGHTAHDGVPCKPLGWHRAAGSHPGARMMQTP